MGAFNPFSRHDGDATAGSSISYLAEPIDLADIGDPNLAVLLRSLRKKDETTKTKALDDLARRLTSQPALADDNLARVWVQLYPRLSIHLSRRIRVLAHNVLRAAFGPLGRSIEQFLPAIVGAWVAGIHDSDRAAAKAASDAFHAVFPNPAKHSKFYIAFQRQIISFVEAVVTKENADTLSDARDVSTDDANMKYSRLVAASVSAASQLVSIWSTVQFETNDDIDALLGSSVFWGLATSPEAPIRRNFHNLVGQMVKKSVFKMDPHRKLISRAYIPALNSDQKNSTGEYLKTLIVLADQLPAVWTTEYRSKVAVPVRLAQFASKGPQSSAPAIFWSLWDSLVSVLAGGIIPLGRPDVDAILDGMWTAMAERRDIGLSGTRVVDCFTAVLVTLSGRLGEPDGSETIKAHLWKLITKQVHPDKPGGVPVGKWPFAFSSPVLVEQLRPLVEAGWADLSARVIGNIRKLAAPSLGAAEKTEIGDEVVRWSDQTDILAGSLKSCTTVEAALREAIQVAIQAVSNDGGRSETAAAVLFRLAESSLRWKWGPDEIESFLTHKSAGLYDSTAGPTLAKTIGLLDSADEIRSTIVADLLGRSDDAVGLRAVTSLAAAAGPEGAFPWAQQDDQLQAIIVGQVVMPDLAGPVHTAFSALFQFAGRVMSAETIIRIFPLFVSRTDDLVESIEPDELADLLERFLRVVQVAVVPVRAAVEMLASTVDDRLVDLLSCLLNLCDSPSDRVSSLARHICAAFARHDDGAVGAVLSDSVLRAVWTRPVTAQSPRPERTANFQTRVVRGREGEAARDLSSLLVFPDWADKMRHRFLIGGPPGATANPKFDGAIYLTNPIEKTGLSEVIDRDCDGLSEPIRFALYFSAILADDPSLIRRRELWDELIVFFVTVYRANGQHGDLDPRRDLWVDSQFGESARDRVTTAYLCARKTMRLMVNQFEPDVLAELVGRMVETISTDSTIWAVSQAECAAYIAAEFANGSGRSASWLASAEVKSTVLTAPPTLSKALLLTCFPDLAQSEEGNKYVNNLVSSILTRAQHLDFDRENIGLLVMFNTLLESNESLMKVVSLPRTGMLGLRLATLVDRMAETKEVEDDQAEMFYPIMAELFDSLTNMIPALERTDGMMWGQIVESAVSAWRRFRGTTIQAENKYHVTRASLVLIHRLVDILAIPSVGDKVRGLDDLTDVFDELAGSVVSGLVDLLAATQQSDEFDDAAGRITSLIQSIIATLTGRPGFCFPSDLTSNQDSLFEVMQGRLPSAQVTAFWLLHKLLPATQAQKSIDVAIGDTVGSLSPVLLRGVSGSQVDPAGIEDYELLPADYHGYLLSWKVLFDHFDTASYRLQEDYLAELKREGRVPKLLDVLATILSLNSDKPFRQTEPDKLVESQSGWQSTVLTRQLASHLFYLALRHLPGVCRGWWSVLGQVQKGRVENWCRTMVSPILRTESVGWIDEWAANPPVNEEPDPAFSVKTNGKACEIVASYVVEDERMSVLVQLPSSYPLHSAVIESGTRVGLTEKRWRSVILISQGIINFSNSSGIVDALIAWRNNVSGVLKGHSECTICYSIISAQRELPTRKCATCRHLFHVSCISKWFKSSPGSTCPFCRSHFYTKTE